MEGDTEGRHTSLHRPGVALSSCSCPAPVLTTLFCPIYSGLAPDSAPSFLELCFFVRTVALLTFWIAWP